MSDNIPVDQKTYKILEYIYDHEECTIAQLFDSFNIKNIAETIRATSPLMYLFAPMYISISNPKLNIMDSVSFDSYVSACNSSGIPLITPDCTAVILPKGAALVETKREELLTLQQQIEPLKEISITQQNRLAQAERDAVSADRDAKFSKIVSIISIIVSIISIVATIILGLVL
jgi:hypothetical protein